MSRLCQVKGVRLRGCIFAENCANMGDVNVEMWNNLGKVWIITEENMPCDSGGCYYCYTIYEEDPKWFSALCMIITLKSVAYQTR